MPVHPTALVEPSVRVDPSAEIGPYSIVTGEVEIGPETRLMAHVFVEGPAAIGRGNLFFPYSTVGVTPQDLKYKGERTETRIGDRNRIREFATIHRGTAGGGGVTAIGSDNLLMAYVHVAHDVRIGDHTVVSNGVAFAGHVVVEDWAVVEAYSGVHQFCRIGRHSFIGPHSVVVQDVLPFSMTVSSREIKTYGANSTGLERRGFGRETIEALQKAFRLLSRSGLNTSQAVERIRAEVGEADAVGELLEFIAHSERGFVK